MTILVSSVSRELIVMLSDSAITVTHHEDEGVVYNEYETGSKYYRFPGVGCITTWGDHIFNQLGRFLQRFNISSSNHSVADLAALTHRYLLEEYRKDPSDELGFHIGGFDKQGKPHLHHVFWGFDRPRNPEQQAPSVRAYDHSDWVFLYNGRNDLAHIVIQTIKDQLDAGLESRFDLGTPYGHIALCDFIARFAAEITPQVGPPFVINLILSDNSIHTIENTSYAPIPLQSIARLIPTLSPIRPQAKVTPVVTDLASSDAGMPTGTASVQPSGGIPRGSHAGTISPYEKWPIE